MDGLSGFCNIRDHLHCQSDLSSRHYPTFLPSKGRVSECGRVDGETHLGETADHTQAIPPELVLD